MSKSSVPAPDLSICSYTVDPSNHKTYRDDCNRTWPESVFSRRVQAELKKLRNKTDRGPGPHKFRKSLPLYRLNENEGNPLSFKELPSSDSRKRRTSVTDSSLTSVTKTINKSPTGPTYSAAFETAMVHTCLKYDTDGCTILLYTAPDFVKPSWQIKFPDGALRDILKYTWQRAGYEPDITPAARLKTKTDINPSATWCKCALRDRAFLIAKDAPGKQRRFYLSCPQPFSNGGLGFEVGPLVRKSKNKSQTKTLELIKNAECETRVRSRESVYDGLIAVLSMRDGVPIGMPDKSKEPWAYKGLLQARRGVDFDISACQARH